MEQKNRKLKQNQSASPTSNQKLSDYFKFLTSSRSSARYDAESVYASPSGRHLRILESLLPVSLILT